MATTKLYYHTLHETERVLIAKHNSDSDMLTIHMEMEKHAIDMQISVPQAKMLQKAIAEFIEEKEK